MVEQDSTLVRSRLGTTSYSGSMGLRGGPPRVPGLTLLAHPSILRIGERCALPKLGSGSEVLLSRSEPAFVAPDGESASPRPLEDGYLSRDPILLASTAEGGIRLTAEGRTQVVANGDTVTEPREFSVADLERGIVLLLADRIALLLHLMDPITRVGVPRHGLQGENSAIVDVRREISRSADMEAPVLIRGATGTGKELVARALHRASKRRNGPFVAINLGAIAPALAPAELFGVVKGAFTGADRSRKGCFERAKGGTLFLDELGEAPSEVQASLLRALETGLVLPVGAEAEIGFDARIVAATDANLESAVAATDFRAPLLHRLEGYEIHLPALADRRDDIGRLLTHFLRQELESSGDPGPIEERGSEEKPWLPAKLVARLARGGWPGNVRQLRNVARRLVVEGRHRSRLGWTPQIEKLLGPTVAGIAEVESAATSTQGPGPPSLPPIPDSSTPGPRPRPGPESDFAAAGIGAEIATETRALRALCVATVFPSDPISEALGPAGARELRTRFYGELRHLLKEWGGFEVASSGGAWHSIFKRPLEAVAWALGYQERLRELAEEHDVLQPLGGRVAIHLTELGIRHNTQAEIASGARVMEIIDDGFSQRALGLTSRILELAAAGQILLTRSVFDLAHQALEPGSDLADPAIRWMRHGIRDLPDAPPRDRYDSVEIFEVGHREIAPLALELASAEVPSAVRRPSEISEDEMIEALRSQRFDLQAAADALGISRPSLYKLLEKSSRVRKARDLEIDEIRSTLAEYGPNLDRVAEHLEVSRRALRRRMTELGMAGPSR